MDTEGAVIVPSLFDGLPRQQQPSLQFPAGIRARLTSHAMIRLFALTVSLLAGGTGQTQSFVEEVHLRGTVENVVMFTEFSGKVIPVDFDPRFVLTIRIASGDPEGRFSAGAVVAFAIHSPALLFGAKESKGRTYEFSVHRKVKRGKTTYFGLKAEEVQTAPAASAPGTG